MLRAPVHLLRRVELWLCIIVISVLAVFFINRIQNVVDESIATAVKQTAVAMQTALRYMHVNWIAQGKPLKLELAESNRNVVFNKYGWPVGVDSVELTDRNQMTDKQCREVFYSLLSHDDLKQGEQNIRTWAPKLSVSAVGSVCMYQLDVSDELFSFIFYDSVSGAITTKLHRVKLSS